MTSRTWEWKAEEDTKNISRGGEGGGGGGVKRKKKHNKINEYLNFLFVLSCENSKRQITL